MSPSLVEILRSDFNDLSAAFSNPRIYLTNHFANLRNTIDIDCELYIQNNGDKQLESTNQQISIINELCVFEKACLNNLPNGRFRDDSLYKRIKDMLDLIRTKLEGLDSLSNTRHTEIKKIDELIYQTWTLLEREIFLAKTLLYLSRQNLKRAYMECEFPAYSEIDPEMDRSIDKQISILFGVLYVIQDEFYCRQRINFEE